MRLGPLSRRASEELVRGLLDDRADAKAVEATVRRADGNPFYLEELVRSVETAPEAIPATVVGMAQSRLQTVSPEARRLLRAASVYGARFWKGGVAALLGEQDGDKIDVLLDELEQSELVVRSRRSAFPGELELEFRQTLLRDAAYALLTDEDRKLGHRLAGEWLLKVGEPDWNLVAQHFERGGARVASQRPGAPGASLAPDPPEPPKK